MGQKMWLIYWHQRLKTAGNINLSHCTYPMLDKGICHTLAEAPNTLQRKSWSALSTASECSLSPILEFDCVWNWKHSTIEAIEDATWAIANWYNNSLESESFDHLNKLMEKKYYRQQSEMLKMKYNDAKHNFIGKFSNRSYLLSKSNMQWQKSEKEMTLIIIGWRSKWVGSLLHLLMDPFQTIHHIILLINVVFAWES